MTTIELGGLTIYPYGLAVAVAALISLLWAAAGEKRCGLQNGTVSWFGLLALPLTVLGARLGYCAVRLPWLLQKDAPLAYFLQLTEGGFLLYGALAGGLAAVALTAKITRQPAARLADHLAAPAALTVALARLAEGLVGQGYGWYVEDWFDPDMGMSFIALEDWPFFARFPFAIPDSYEDWCWAVFVAEAVMALVIMALLLRIKGRKAGARAVWFVLAYAAMQSLGESLRQDAVLRWGFVRANQVFSAVIVLGVLLVCTALAKPPKGKRFAGCFAGMLVGMGVVMAMEFALEKKIVFLEWMPMDICYVICCLACVGMILSIQPMWRKAFPKEA